MINYTLPEIRRLLVHLILRHAQAVLVGWSPRDRMLGIRGHRTYTCHHLINVSNAGWYSASRRAMIPAGLSDRQSSRPPIGQEQLAVW